MMVFIDLTWKAKVTKVKIKADYQTKKLHSEGSYQQNAKAIYWMGENICK